ncbi:response regulator [Wenjunlia tyrosinilytica]|jgi:DNA-binding NarL/FixJ family response regulator|uniref:DNA-binding response regulator n=1 Tax=Wenjunlia tyrosinilytica TaxID=1544741 RepID=A0A917ZUQ2_9ACTN|nr:response regulator transcription factor [Wenjunlia tyrosinilytica]GGO96380.1 DNA-binding response regulator [Wenjunlia tyrosinilytica]
MIRVLVADDEPLVREGIRLVLDSDDEITVVAEAVDGSQAVDSARRHHPDLAILDIRMPTTDGLTAVRALALLPHRPRVIILTSFALDEYLYAALSAGADGFLVKDVSRHDLLSSVKAVANGDAIISPSMTRSLIQRFTPPPARSTPGVKDQIAALPEELRQVLALLSRGLSNAEIGALLCLTESQVKAQVSRVLRLLRLTNRVQAAILAYSVGLSDGPPSG